MEYECKACGRFRKEKIKPLAGDHVCFSVADGSNGIIEQIEKRKNFLIRPPISNIDKLAIVVSASTPCIDFYLCDKLLAQAKFFDIEPLVCISKNDENKAFALNIKEQYKYFKTFILSVKTGEGIEELKKEIKNSSVCFTGQSAVGKSSLINKIDETANLKTGEISRRTERGKHTTRVTELIYIADINAFVCDTPGFSSLELNIEKHEHLQQQYPEFESFKDNCRYTGCLHYKEPNCGVKEAVNLGKISKERYTRYINIMDKRNH